MLKSAELAGFWKCPCTYRTFFSLVIKNQISSSKFLFQVYGNMLQENIMYQQLQKICREKVCRMNAFQANSPEISFAPQTNGLLLHLCVFCLIQWQFWDGHTCPSNIRQQLLRPPCLEKQEHHDDNKWKTILSWQMACSCKRCKKLITFLLCQLVTCAFKYFARLWNISSVRGSGKASRAVIKLIACEESKSVDTQALFTCFAVGNNHELSAPSRVFRSSCFGFQQSFYFYLNQSRVMCTISPRLHNYQRTICRRLRYHK